MSNRFYFYILILLLGSSIFFYSSCDSANNSEGPYECEIQFINNHPTLQYSLFLGLNDDFFDIENIAETDIINGENIIANVASNGGTGSYTLELGMDEQIQKDWAVGTFTEFDVWSFLSPNPIEDGDGFTFVRDTNYTIEIENNGNTVTISN